ncbi:endo-1,4-beta-xylanase [Natrinema sp. DC36]|uniref:endo-1,4-beta-xylanase n=1 Tax=Natrinema sp. DC36 TaxID=2878680 RepID=UPI001CEFEEAC|nr:endo-1,4-beta-xylanase [Natrinema sp. DC36]
MTDGDDTDRDVLGTSGETDGAPDRVSRRAILEGLGLGGLTVTAGCAIRQRGNEHRGDNGTVAGGPNGEAGDASADSSWETAADKRIRRHRTAPLEVVVADERGDPIADARVAVEMQRHAFGFGTAVNAAHLVEETDPGDEYRTAITDLFNKAVLENRHKWNFWEIPSHRKSAETATWWLLDRGLELRGHTCIWQRRNQGAIPDDVLQAMNSGDGAYIESRSDEHVSDIVGTHSGAENVTEWDVLNEPVEFHEMTDLIDPDAPSTRAPKIVDWYRIAADADPDARLYVNEYEILVGDNDEQRDALEAIVTYARENNAPLEGIGMQGHHWREEQRRSPSELLSTLDRFAELVPSIQITEYDAWGTEWTEDREAEYLYEFLKTVFSHPVVDGFTMWGFWDAIHWQNNAPLFREDWSRKPAYDVYTGLVFDQWWTQESGRTGSDGRFSTSGFLGDYEITATANGDRKTTSVTLDDPTASETVRIQFESESSSP